MRDFVDGMHFVFEAWKDDDFYPFACAEEGEINMQSELLPASTAATGAWEEFRPSGKNSWAASLSGVIVLRDLVDQLWFSWELFVEAIRRNGLDMRFTYTDRTLGFSKTQRGKVYLPETGHSFKADDFARWFAKLQGSGPLDPTGLLATPVNTKQVRIDWEATGAEPNIVQDNRLIGILLNQIMEVSWEGDDKFKPIGSGDPNAKQVRHDGTAGTLRFLNSFEPGDYIYCLIEEA